MTRLIAFYLPQFHPIPENNKWWGEGFTEWTNVKKAKPLFKGHMQPNIPGELGYYDLRYSEERYAQAELAKYAGIEGFCYWHYWFGDGKVLLERPFQEVVTSGEPKLPFCVAWANESWTGKWHGLDSSIIQKQSYPGLKDARDHFYYLLDAFSDDRYIKVDGKPLFIIYRPYQIPGVNEYLDLFRELAEDSGLGGLYILGFTDTRVYQPKEFLLDGLIYSGFTIAINEAKEGDGQLANQYRNNKVRVNADGGPLDVYTYEAAAKAWMNYPDFDFDYYPVVFPNWDNSPRCGTDSVIICDSTPALWRDHLLSAMDRVRSRKDEQQLIFIKSWNEWAEGNYLEPDKRYGRAYLEIVREAISLPISKDNSNK